MIVYVESNFIIEWAAAQEESIHCDQLLRWGEAGNIDLVIPAFSISEPIQTIHRRHAQRRRLQQELAKDINLLGRTGSYRERLRQGTEVVSILDESRREEQRRLDDVLERITAIAEVVPLDRETLGRARVLREEHDLKQPDAIVLASVVIHLETDPKGDRIFIQKDRKDFLNPDIADRLAQLGCELFGSFQAGVGRIGAAGS